MESASSVQRASAYLLGQAEQQFAEARHEMTFSHAAGFTGHSETQVSDIFARATLANLFLDIADYAPEQSFAAAFRQVVCREARYIAGAKLTDRAGGWSYFPDLPELPPDADSLAAALSLFTRAAPEYSALCEEAVQCVLAGAGASGGEDGSQETWIISPRDPPELRDRMRWAIETFWGSGTDPDVLAHFHHALFLYAPDRYREAIRRGAAKLTTLQHPEGHWDSTWYAGPAFGTWLAIRLLRETGMETAAVDKARAYLIGTQRADGRWGYPVATPLDTALSMIALKEAGAPSGHTALERGREVLADLQLADGSWQDSPWIKMEIGRATGKILRVVTYQSVTMTTAFCLKALLG